MIARLNLGGPARCVIELSKRMAHRGFETRVATGACPPYEGDMGPELVATGTETILIPGLQRNIHPIREVRAFFALKREISRFRPRIVHTHTAKAGFLGRLAARTIDPRPKVVHTFHGHVLDSYFGPFRSSLFRRLERFLAARTDALIAVSPSVRDELLLRHGLGRADQYHVIPSGFPEMPAGDGTDLKAELGWQDATVAGVIGRMVPIKGHRLLLEAMPSLLQKVPALKFLFVGDGPLRPMIESVVSKPPFKDAVRLTGFRSDRERIYRTLDLVILPSLKEGLPTVLLEAAAAGCAVAASRIPGVEDLCTDGENALLFEPSSPTSLAEAVLRLALDGKLRSCLVENAMRTVVGRVPGYDAVAEAHDRLYRALLEKEAR